MKINYKKMLALVGCMALTFQSIEGYAKEAVEIVEETETEEDVITYFNELEEETDDLLKEKGQDALERLKEIGSKFIGFMLDEEEICGFYFSDLKEETKEKITDIFLKVDTKISEKYPNYMQDIKIAGEKATDFIKETYQKAKEKVSTLVDTYVDDELKEDVKDSIKDGVSDMKEAVGFWKEKVTSWTKK